MFLDNSEKSRSWLSDVLGGNLWRGWRLFALWVACIGVLAALGSLRVKTDAELAIASFAILPVLAIAWLGGKAAGVLAAALATAMWTLGDLSADRQVSAAWIQWTNAAARLMTYSVVALLAAQVRLQFMRERESATQDALTGLKNRRAFLDAGVAEVERARRHSRPLAVVYLDLDNFKQLNDSKGHDAGDAALCATAAALVNALRSTDQIARLGGDEFVVLLPETDYEAAADVGARLCVAVNDAMRNFAPVRASVGVAWFPKADLDFSAMLNAADKLMYEAKKSRTGELRIGAFTSDHAKAAWA